MPLSPAPALLVGLGARIVLDYLTRSGEASIRDFVLLGVWQGVGLHYASKITSLAILVGFGVSAKILVEFNLLHDITRTVTTLLGVALGVLCTECLSQFFGAPKGSSDPDRRRKRSQMTDGQSLRRERVVQFEASGEGDGNDARQRAFRETVHTVSDITSVDSSSEMIGPTSAMSKLDREIATLRTRASLADSERRRFKEERKWAISQGNVARASQMKWQVKRYTALMQSFHREADNKLLEASSRARQARTEEPKASSSKQPTRRREPSNGPLNGHAARSPDTTPPKRHSKQPVPPRDTMR